MTEKEQVILKQTDENKNDFDLEIEEVDLSQVRFFIAEMELWRLGL